MSLDSASVDRFDFLRNSVAVLLTPVLPNGQPLPSTYNPLDPYQQPVAGGNSATGTIAVVGPMSGLQTQVGQQMINGVRAACDDANRLRGNLDLFFTARPFDDQDQPVQGALTASFAVNDHTVLGVVGHGATGTTDSALRIYQQAQMPIVVPISSANVITSHGYRNVFRLPTSDGAEGRIAARMLVTRAGVASCAIVRHDVDYANDLATTFVEECRSAKIPVGDYVLIDGTDPSTLAATVLASRPRLVYLSGKVDQLGGFLTALRARDPNVAVAASQGFFAPATTKTYAKAAEGMHVTTSIPPMTQASADEQVISDYSARYGQFTPVAGFSYAAAQVLIAASRRRGASNRGLITTALSDGSAYQTIAGDFRFTPFGDPVDPNLYLYTVEDGEWAYERSYRPTPFAITKNADV